MSVFNNNYFQKKNQRENRYVSSCEIKLLVKKAKNRIKTFNLNSLIIFSPKNLFKKKVILSYISWFIWQIKKNHKIN